MSNWNEVHEAVLKKWSEMVKTYAIIHSVTAQYFSWWNQVLGIPIVILSAIMTSSIFVTADKSYYYVYVNGCLALLITILTGISKFLNLSQLEISHRTASFKYMAIGMNIDTILSFSRKDRNVCPEDILNSTKLSILDIREQAQPIPGHIIKGYLSGIKKTILLNINTDVNTQETESPYKKLQKTHTTLMHQILTTSNSQESYRPGIFVPTTGPHGPNEIELPVLPEESKSIKESSSDEETGVVMSQNFNDKTSQGILNISKHLNSDEKN